MPEIGPRQVLMVLRPSAARRATGALGSAWRSSMLIALRSSPAPEGERHR
ncbi:hypothetical protein [Kitasatospora sp. NPDC058478]